MKRADLDRALVNLLFHTVLQIGPSTLEMAKWLLESGASPMSRDSAGFLLLTNIRAAVWHGHADEARGQRKAGSRKVVRLPVV